MLPVEGQKSRAYFSDKHNAMLENIYTTNQYPNKDLKAELAEKIKITEVQVRNEITAKPGINGARNKQSMVKELIYCDAD